MTTTHINYASLSIIICDVITLILLFVNTFTSKKSIYILCYKSEDNLLKNNVRGLSWFYNNAENSTNDVYNVMSWINILISDSPKRYACMSLTWLSLSNWDRMSVLLNHSLYHWCPNNVASDINFKSTPYSTVSARSVNMFWCCLINSAPRFKQIIVKESKLM